MKKGAWILAAGLLVALLLWMRSGSDRFDPKGAPAAPAVPRPLSGSHSDSATPTAAVDRETAAADAKTASEALAIDQREARAHETAIVFYGLVLDQFDQPVPQAQIEYESVGGSFEGSRALPADPRGAFTIAGIRGKTLRVRVAHPHYYDDGPGSRYYVYANNNRGPNFRPDPDKPEVFRLRRKGQAAELIQETERVLFNQDETERSFSLYDHSRRRDQPDYVIVRPVDRGRTNAQGKRVLDLELSAPAGGLQLRTDPFQFTAPTAGYQSTLVTPPAVMTPVNIFVRFDSGNYGRFTIAGGGGQYDVESYLNPDKSPNLEYDPGKRIRVIRNGRMGLDLLYPSDDEKPGKP